MIVNGQSCEIAAGEPVLTVLFHLGLSLDSRGVAVAVDGEVVPRTAWRTLELAEDAHVEVLTAMQGG